jgi:CRISPR type III-A-associated protein Csm2
MSKHYNNQKTNRTHGQNAKQSAQRNEILEKFKVLIKNKSFIDDEVMSLSKDLGESLSKDEEKENTKTQIRKFYNLVKVAQNSAHAKEIDMVKVKLRTLQAQVTYALARKIISKDFKDFFDESLNQILKSPDLKQSLSDFAVFFEALYAYFYFYSTKEKVNE